MSDLNINILIENIKKIMKDKNISQTELAEILGMSQPNISKALKHKEGKCFTLAQVYDLSRHFNISIDELVGNVREMDVSISPRSTAAFITKLAEAHSIEFIPYSRTEEVFKLVEDTSFSYFEYSGVNEKVIYPAIILKSYWSPKDAPNEEAFQESLTEASQVGNETAMLPVNKYLEQFQEIFKLYEKGVLPKHIYETVIASLLSHLKE